MTDDIVAPRECIFCKAYGMTHEHVWPDWLASYIPKNLANHRALTAIVYKDRRPESKIKTWDGDPRSRRLNVVCERCNTGWMSELQQATKPILLPLLDSRTAFLRPYQQKLLAAWSAMCIMTAENYEPSQIAVPFEDREYLRLYREAPPHWRVWIGRYVRGKLTGYWVHHSLPITENIPDLTDPTPPPLNTQISTFVVGELYIHAFSSTTPGLVDMWGLSGFSGLSGRARSVLAQIWPVRESFIAWPTEDIWDVTADQIAGFIFNKLDHIGRTFGY